MFHRIDGYYDSETFVTNCEFTLCNARSGGGLETDARNVVVIGTAFKSCSSEKKKINGRDKDGNGGGMNVWALNGSARAFYEKIGMKVQKIGMETIL